MTSKIDLSSFNEAQREAITHENGPMLVIAGAGTGKTAVITNRISWLIQEKGVRPDNILALTFTEKTSREMEERVDKILPIGLSQVRIATFHGFCERILRDFALEIGLDPSFKILTVPEQWLMIRRHLFELPLDYFRPLGNPTKFLQAIVSAIGAAKDQDLAPERFKEYALYLENNSNEEDDEKKKLALREEAVKWNEFANVYKAYGKMLIEESAMDFGDIILNTLHLFRERPSVLQKVRDNLSEVLVDEFQDTNGAQNALLRLMVPDDNGPITVVGDDDQSIYAWRGSNLTNIFNFQKWYPTCKKIVLVRNYRSTQSLLNAAYQLIQFNNPLRLEKTANVDKRLLSSKEYSDPTPAVTHHHFSSIEQEADFIADTIVHGIEKQGRQLRDYTVLMRTNSQADFIVPALARRDIVYHVAEARGLFLRPEIRDQIAYLKTVFNPDDTVSLFRLISDEIFGIPPFERQRLLAESREKNVRLIDLLKKISENELAPEDTKIKITALLELLVDHVSRIKSASASAIALEFMQKSGYLKRAVENAEKNPEVLPNLNAFIQYVRDFELSDPQASIYTFLEFLDLVLASGQSPSQAEISGDYEAVRIMTVHGAKGLEFPLVFLFGATSDKYPIRERGDVLDIPDYFSAQKGLDSRDLHIQEERRLFYVAMTRAKERLIITSADLSSSGKSRKKYSKFIAEAGIETLVGKQGTLTEQLKLPLAVSSNQGQALPLKIPNAISASQVEVYESCPLKYKFQYVYRIPVPPNHALTFGIVVHAVLREIARLNRGGKKVTIEDALSLYEKFWSGDGFESKAHEERQKIRGRELIVNYLENNPNILNKAPLFFEEPFRLRFDNITVNGRIDRVDRDGGLILVTDYKTGSPKDQKFADDDLQLSVYALALNEVFNLHADRLALSYLEGPVDRRTTRTPEELAKAKERLKSAMEGIQKRYFTATPGPFVCQYCPFKRICNFSSV